MSIRYLFAAATAILSACGSSYNEAPNATAYVAQLVSAEVKSSVSTIGMCFERSYKNFESAGTVHWFATVRMNDQTLYHYDLKLDETGRQSEEEVVLKFRSTLELREKLAEQTRPSEGCLDEPQPYFIKDKGDGRGLRTYVSEAAAVSASFDEYTKSVFQRALKAAEVAAAAHKTYVPPQKSWGIKP